MNRDNAKPLIRKIDYWLNTPTSSAAQPNTLRWWVTANLFDKCLYRVVMLATLASSLYLFGCNSTTNTPAPPPGTEYIGLWENAKVPALTMTINRLRQQRGDQFLIHTMELGGTEYLATAKNGLLQLNDGSGVFFQYHKDTDTITSSGNNQFLYRRKKK
ncbi:MAG TPA: hypothetical protein VFK06_24685 [Candidatus Angelobacter sp.]|nr:hypothetical protein [Candidatus Angelobacter sp.]